MNGRILRLCAKKDTRRIMSKEPSLGDVVYGCLDPMSPLRKPHHA
jgi:hypothetical protein